MINKRKKHTGLEQVEDEKMISCFSFLKEMIVSFLVELSFQGNNNICYV